jgi:plasmid stabilization system protein ParE
MKVVFTDDALRDLDEILQYISAIYPNVYGRSRSVCGPS